MVTLVIVDAVQWLVTPDLEPSAVKNDEEERHDDHASRHHGHQDQEQGRVLCNRKEIICVVLARK